MRARTSDVLQPEATLPASPLTREPVPEDPQQQARRLNELGALHRREGNYELAAEQHRAALAIVRDLGDRRAEALTLNNLALALAHTGVPTALQHFEQSLVVLRELGDEEHEGQVIANLGFVHRRQGRSEEATRSFMRRSTSSRRGHPPTVTSRSSSAGPADAWSVCRSA